MAIARVSAQDATGSGTNSVSATYPSTPTSGNLLVAVVYANDGNGANTLTGWTSAVDVAASSNEIQIFYKVSAGTEGTINVTNGVPTSMEIGIYEYSGVASSSPLDKTAGSSNFGLTCSTGTTATTTQADELLIGGAGFDSVAETFASATNSFNLRNSINTHLFTIDRIVSATGTYESTITVTGGSANAQGAIATFKAAPTGLTVTTQPPSLIGITTATGNGTITDITGGNADEKGFVYSTSTQSAPGNVAPGSSGYSGLANDTGGSYGLGAFTKAITGLTQGTTYYIRAYAHSTSTGYAYGSELTFLTAVPVSSGWLRI